MGIGAVLEGAVHASDQRDFPTHLVQWCQSRRECQGMPAGRDRLAFKTPDVVLAGEVRQCPFPFAGKEAAARDAVRQVEEGQSLSRYAVLALTGIGKAFKPRKAEGSATGASDEPAA